MINKNNIQKMFRTIVFKLRISVFLFSFLLALPSFVFGQCSGGTAAGALSPVPSSAYQTMNVTSGNYYTFVVPAGCLPTYDFSYCAANGSNASFDTQITILDNTGAYTGGYNDDFCGLQSHVTWTPTAAGTYRVLVSTYFCGGGNTALLAYRTTTPPNMTFTSCTTVQASTAGVTKCDLDQQIICVQVVTSGSCSPMSLTQFNLAAGSSTSGTLADISKIHIYYTGTTNVFNTTNEFVLGGTTPSGGSNTIVGSQTLVAGTNYFWIAYDINPASTTGNLVDASCTQITVGGVNRVPTATNPAGTRTIAVCPSYPGTSALGLKNWVKSDVGVTGSPVSSWADQSGAGITGNLNQATAANRPAVIASAVNYQDYLRFDGVNDILVSANTFTGPTLFGSTDNTIFMVKNIRSGLVDYKWENNPTNSWRVGMELNGTRQRFDFVNDNAGGKNDISTTNISNKDVIVAGVTDASSIALRLNGNLDATINNPGLNMSGAATAKPLNIGGNDLGNPLYCNVDIAEVMTYNKKLSSSEMKRVESYLCLKYGITMGNNAGAGPASIYMASDGTQIWNGQTGYHNYVIGLGRDNAAGNSGLHKIKTQSVSSLNGSTDIIALANSNFTTPVALTNDKSFLVVGSNAGSLTVPISTGYSHGGPVTAICCQTSRVWATQKTGTFTGNLIVEVDMALISGPSGFGSNTNVDIRLLVDDDANFSNASAGEYTYSPLAGYSATGGKIYFSVPYANIQTGTGYFTIGSVNAITAPLPIELTNFSAECKSNNVEIRWTTASETNNDYFEINRSDDGIYFETIATVDGAGNSTIARHYTYTDNFPLSKDAFYRLRQIDFDGESKTFNTIMVSCEQNEMGDLQINNSFFENNTLFFTYNVFEQGAYTISLFDIMGNVLETTEKYCYSKDNSGSIDMNEYAAGVYVLSIKNTSKQAVRKILIIK